MASKTVLVVDDDGGFRAEICDKLRDRGLICIEAANGRDVLRILRHQGQDIAVALLDIRLPSREGSDNAGSSQGRREGLTLARAIREHYPRIRLLAMSSFADEDVRTWFAEYGHGYMPKTWLTGNAAPDCLDFIENLARRRVRRRSPKVFVVHGHDRRALGSLMRFVEKGLGWARPQVLRDTRNCGRTIIEKFEDAAQNVDVVFVLLTPDDTAAPLNASNSVKRRARQNVIFEMGYFFAKLQRTSGRIVLLHKGPVELPSDIAGVTYVDISVGLAAAGGTLRKELQRWL